MRLSTRARYAVMAMVDLAKQETAQAVTLADIAGRQEISLSYLEQLFAQLRRAQLVKSNRGPGGGYRLARVPQQIYIADIVLAVEEPLKTTRCADGTTGCMSNGSQCLAHNLWAELERKIHSYLASVTLTDVCASRFAGKPECAGTCQHKTGGGEKHAALS